MYTNIMRRYRKLVLFKQSWCIKPSCPDTCSVLQDKKGSVWLLLET